MSEGIDRKNEVMPEKLFKPIRGHTGRLDDLDLDWVDNQLD